MSSGRVHVTHLGGDAFAIDLGRHRVVVDQPVGAGGDDTGPTPTDLFVGSVASCAAFFAGRFLRRHVAAGTSFDVDCVFETSEERPARVREIRLVVDVDAPLGDEVRAGLLRAVEHCTVHNSLRTAPEIAVSVREPEPARP